MVRGRKDIADRSSGAVEPRYIGDTVTPGAAGEQTYSTAQAPAPPVSRRRRRPMTPKFRQPSRSSEIR